MAVVERNVWINASYAAIEQATTLAPHDWPQWFVGVETAQPEAGYPQEGSVVNIHYKASGLAFELKQRLVKFVPNQTTIFQMEGMINGTQTWTGQPEGTGVRIRVVFDYDMPGGGLGKMLDKLVIERINTQNLEQSLNNLKAFLER
ncbi:MAG: SRPBCC family protein [Anaerolineae bacterium]|jgi:hypothetical protein|nr:SRPBCC family protein [Anaerolineae bacterium]